ncbi:MAG: hypothetical protein HKN26_15990 [Acidimicrobiales bacterium]|nr:hypothetical protein [Acidimicrobiales bacterium]
MSPYRTVRRGGVKILLSPNLATFANSVVLDVKGIRKRVTAEIRRADGSCSI